MASYQTRAQAAARVAPRGEALEVREGERNNRFGPKPEAPQKTASADRRGDGVYRGGAKPRPIPGAGSSGVGAFGYKQQPGVQRA